MYQSIPQTPSNQRVFGACLLSFMILIAPMASVGAATRRATAPPVVVIKVAETVNEAATSSGGENKESANQPSLLRRLAGFLLGPLPPSITATMTDAYPAHPSGKAEPGDTITYTADISNGAGVDPATGVMFDATLDANTTIVPGSLKVSPLAFPDAYNVEQNTTLNTQTPPLPGVLANDTGTPTPTAVPIAAGATTQGGTVTLNADGSFIYNPPSAVFTGPDTFTYTATNGQAPPNVTDAQAIVTINVNSGANDAPTDIAITASTVAENAAINTVVGDFSTTDIDTGDTFTYTLVAGTGSTNNASFNILGNQLRTSASFNFESTPSFSIRVRSTDAGGLFFEKQFTITVTNVNEAPTDIALSANTVGENMPINTVIGNLSTTEPDAGDTFTYTLVAGTGDTDNASFNINGNQLRSSIIFDFETKSSYSIRVRSTDAGSLNFEKQFTITIVNNNDTPTDIALSSNTVPENSAINTVVGNFSTTDQDGGAFTYTLVAGAGDTDNASFNINVAQLRTSAMFDFETKSSYTIRVRSTDSGAAFFEKQFTITVTDVAEAPVLVTSVGSASFTEDGPAVAVDTGITVADQDSATLASATIQITGNFQTAEDVLGFVPVPATMGNIAVLVPYNSVTGLLTLGSAGSTATLAQWQAALRAVTYNNTSQNPNTTARTVSFRATDPGALQSNLATKGVTVTAVNDAPVLANSGPGLSYTENGAAAVINNAITITDVDSTNLTGATVSITANLHVNKDVLAYAPALGITGSYDGTTGILTLTGTTTLANYQTALRNVTYSSTSEDPSTLARTVTFQVNDGGAVNNLSNTINSTVNVTAVNDAPTATAYAGLPAQAGIPIAYPAGKLNGTDNAEEAANGTVVTIATTPDSVTNGTVTINADGSFTFTPNSNGLAASFTYHVNDDGKPGAGVSSTPATVSFTVAGPALYFVKNPAVNLGNCTLGNECLLATAVTNIGASTNARIFIGDANNHAAAVPLQSGGWLIGQGVTGTTFDILFGINPTPAQGTLAPRPSLGLARPTVQNTVTLNATSSVRGLNISSTTSTGMADQAGSISGVTVSEVAVTTTTGTAVLLSSVTSSTFSFTGLTTTGGAGLALTGTNTSSTFTFTTVSVSSGANAAFTATGGGTINVTGSTNDITTTTGVGVNIASTAIGGSGVTFRNITVSGTAANGINLSTTSGNFTVTGPTNLGTSGGTGPTAPINILNYSTGTISFAAVDIQRRGGTGILINNFDGTSATFGATTIPNQNAAGGYGIRIEQSSAPVNFPSATISDANVTSAQTDGNTDNIPDSDGDGDAIFLKNNTGSFTLSGGTLSNCGNDCIDGRTVASLTLNNVTINTPGVDSGGQGQGGHGISLIDISGTSNMDELLVQQFGRSQTDGFRAINTNVNGTVNVTDARFENTFAAGASAGNDGIFFEMRGTSNMTLLVDEVNGTSKFKGLFGEGIQVSTGAVSTGTTNVTVTDTEFVDAHIGTTQTGSGHNGLRTHGVGAGDLVVDIQRNTFTNVAVPLFQQGVISLFTNNNASVKGTVKDNTILNATQAGMQVFCDNLAGETITEIDLNLEANTINNTSGQGILVNLGSGGSVAEANIRINSNNIGQAVGGAVGDGQVLFGFGGGPNASQEGVRIEVFGSGAKTVNLKMNANNVRSDAVGVNTTFPPANETLQIAVSQNATLNATVTNNQLIQLDDTSNGAALFAQTFNGSPAGTPNICLDFTTNTGNTAIDFFLSKGGAGNFLIENIAGVVAANTGVWSPANPNAAPYANSAGCAEPPLNVALLSVPNTRQYEIAAQQTPIQPQAAIAGEINGSNNSGSLSLFFSQVTSSLAQFANSVDSMITPTAYAETEKTEVRGPRSEVSSQRSEVRSQKSDVRLNHAKSPDRTLSHHPVSKQKAPLANALTVTSAMLAAAPPFPISIGTIPAGKSVRVTFQVTLNNPLPGGTTQVSSQGTVTFNEPGSPVLTDDPAVGGASDPTVTLVSIPTDLAIVNTLGDAADINVGDNICDSDAAAGDQCTLRAAIQETNAAATADSIGFNLPANSTITLLSALDSINGDLTITGPSTGVTVSGNNSNRVFTVLAGKTVSISNLTIANGQSTQGGGISNLGNLTISNTTFTGNKAVGGAAEGGAIYSNSGTLTIINSTLSGNSADGNGGGLLNSGSSAATLVNVTITNNRADHDNSLIGDGGGISVTGGTVTLRNTIVAGNFNDMSPSTTPDDINGTVDAASSFNLIGTGGSGGLTNGVNNNQVGVVDAGLGVLASNDGPTQTHALLFGSVALDAGDDAVTGVPLSLTTDQRGTGFPRQVDSADANPTATVDIGAFEAGLKISGQGLYYSNSVVFLRNTPTPGPADFSFSFGSSSVNDYQAISGDWNKDGRDTIGLYHEETGFFFLTDINSGGPGSTTFQFGAGNQGYIPIAGDWDGDGFDTVGIYDPATGMFFLRNSNAAGAADIVFPYGAGGLNIVPVAGDWDGDGDDTVGIYDLNTGMFFLRNSNTAGPADLMFQFGAGGEALPVVGDWNGDGTTTVGIYVRSTAGFFMRNLNSAGPADVLPLFTFSTPGGEGQPLAGDWAP